MNKHFLVAAIIACALLLSGCSVFQRDSDRQTSGTVRERTVESPTADGGKVTLRETTSESAETAHSHSGFDDAFVAGAARIGTAAATGDWGALLGVGSTALLAAGGAFLQRRDAQAHKRDADEGWQVAMDALKQQSAPQGHPV